MFGINELFDYMTEGKEVEAYGEKWIIIKTTKMPNVFLAVKSNDILPCQMYLIEIPNEKEKSNNDR